MSNWSVVSDSKSDRMGGMVPDNRLLCSCRSTNLVRTDSCEGIVLVNLLPAIDNVDNRLREEIALGIDPRNKLL